MSPSPLPPRMLAALSAPDKEQTAQATHWPRLRQFGEMTGFMDALEERLWTAPTGATDSATGAKAASHITHAWWFCG